MIDSEVTSPVVSIRLSDREASELEASCGFIVAQVPDQGDRPTVQHAHVATESQAWGMAAGLALRHPGLVFAVYRPARTYHAPPGRVPTQEATA